MKHSPSTRNSLNVGIEIIEVVGNSHIVVDLYYSNPEDASPAKPRFLTATPSANNHPLLTRRSNDPDLDHFDIYKDKGAGWQYLATTADTFYEDTQETIVIEPQANTITVSYKVKAIDTQGRESTFSNPLDVVVKGIIPWKISPSSRESTSSSPRKLTLSSNYPNPFNPVTHVEFGLPHAEWVTLKVYDLLGREVKTLVSERLDAGNYTVQWDGRDDLGRPVASGIYPFTCTVCKRGNGC